MKQKIIGLVSGLALFGGFVAAGILSAGEPTLLQCMALGAVALIGGAGAFYTYWADNEKAPDERQLSQGADRKIFNIIIADGRMMVNGRECKNSNR